MVKPAENSTEASVPENVVSSLMPWVLGEPEQDVRLKTLDFGYASAPTVHFFSQFTCTLYFAALIDPEINKFNSDQMTHADKVKRFKKVLNIPNKTQIDIILFWDLFCYLDRPAINALLEAVRPYVHKHTRAHSIGLLNNRYQLPAFEYGLCDRTLLAQQPNDDLKSKVYNHSRQQFNDSLDYWRVDKSCLLADGRVENVLLVKQ
jgi:hypothetical protein